MKPYRTSTPLLGCVVCCCRCLGSITNASWKDPQGAALEPLLEDSLVMRDGQRLLWPGAGKVFFERLESLLHVVDVGVVLCCVFLAVASVVDVVVVLFTQRRWLVRRTGLFVPARPGGRVGSFLPGAVVAVVLLLLCWRWRRCCRCC